MEPERDTRGVVVVGRGKGTGGRGRRGRSERFLHCSAVPTKKRTELGPFVSTSCAKDTKLCNHIYYHKITFLYHTETPQFPASPYISLHQWGTPLSFRLRV